MLVGERGDGPRHVFVGHPAAAVHVGDEADAQPGQRRRQAGDWHGGARHAEFVARHGISVRGRAGQAAGAGSEQGLEDRAAGDGHRLV